MTPPPFPPHHVERLVAIVMCQLAGASEDADDGIIPNDAWGIDAEANWNIKAWLEGIDGRTVHLDGCYLFDLRVSE